MAQFTGKTDEGGILSSLRTVGGDVMPHVNHGALFGFHLSRLFTNRVEAWVDNAAFAVISVAAALLIGYWATLQSTARDRFLCASLGLILAGTLGNLYDRIVFGGVRDFIHWHYDRSFDWPVFNIADCCLVIGASLLLLQAFFVRPTDETEEPAAESAVAVPSSAGVQE
jgi:lipoprotein signal peptidase